MSTSIENAISSEIECLSPEQQDLVLHFVRQLKSSQDRGEPRKAILTTVGSMPHDDIERMKEAIKEGCESITPQGTPGTELMKLVGSIPHEDLEKMKVAIEEDCGQVDSHGW